MDYPKLGPALVEAAVMGYGVIAYDRGHFFLAFWDGDEALTPMLTWDQCEDCGDICHGERQDCSCAHKEVEVA